MCPFSKIEKRVKITPPYSTYAVHEDSQTKKYDKHSVYCSCTVQCVCTLKAWFPDSSSLTLRTILPDYCSLNPLGVLYETLD